MSGFIPDDIDTPANGLVEKENKRYDALHDARLIYAERLRHSEVLRQELENKLDKLETTYYEAFDKHRTEANELLNKLIDAKDHSQKLTLASVDLEKKLAHAIEHNRALEKEKLLIIEKTELVQAQLHLVSTSYAKDSEYFQKASKKSATQLNILSDSVDTLRAKQHELEQEIFEKNKHLDEAINALAAEQESNKHAINLLLQQHEELQLNNKTLTTQLEESAFREQALRKHNHEISASHESLQASNTLAQEQLENKNKKILSMVGQEHVSILQEECERYRNALVLSNRKFEVLRLSKTYLAGKELIKASKNLKNLLLLPVTLFKLKQQHASSASSPATSPVGSVGWINELNAVFIKEGLTTAEPFARRKSENKTVLANALTQLAKLMMPIDAQESIRLGRESIALDPRPYRVKWFALFIFDTGSIKEANALLQGLPKSSKLSVSQRYKIQYISGCNRLLEQGPTIPEPRAVLVANSRLAKILYISASSLPYHISGYTTRTHNILKAIKSSGRQIACVTRPGYPHDRSDSLMELSNELNSIDGVDYEALPGPHRRKFPTDDYISRSAEIILKKARKENFTLIHAASNYEAALPGLIAARKLGIPFIYEVRGLWEYTSAAKTPGWEHTERFALDRDLETLTAKNADIVLTLTSAMGHELHARGVPLERIYLAPNAIDPNAFIPIPRNDDLAQRYNLENSPFVIGYIGSILIYEGLDDLIKAFAEIHKVIPESKLLIVGDGDALPSLRDLANKLQLGDGVIFSGKIAHSAVQQHFSLLSVVALPRKPYKVCELVSPLKPLEAMAMGVPLVVSDVAALKEMVRADETALVYKSADIKSLTEALLRIAREPGLAQRLSEAARQDVLSRTWEGIGGDISSHYARLLEPGTAAEPNGICQAISTPAVAIHVTPPQPEGHIEVEPIILPIGKNSMTAVEKKLFDEKLLSALKRGNTYLLHFVAQQIVGRSPKFSAFCQIKAANCLLSAGYIDDATTMADQALTNDPGIGTLRGVARIFYNATHLEKACELVNHLSESPSKTERDEQFISEVRNRALLFSWASQPAQPRSIPVQAKRVLNVLAFSLPYASVGYATRSHGLAQAILNAGWDIRPYTRPGFPYDFKPELQGKVLPASDEVDGVTYRRLFDIKRTGMSEVDYLLHAIEHFERVIDMEQPEIVHAASNYVTALPALIACRRKGVPFVYEVRGFWEVTRSSVDESFTHTSKYRFMQLFEGLVARQADAVITITTAMQDELVNRGVASENIAIAYNSVDPTRFVPRAANLELARRLGIPQGIPVIGYIGSFVDYEGLDDLVFAAGGLKDKGYDFRLLMVGDGAALAALRELVQTLGLQEHVLLIGRVPHDEVEDYYSLIDIAPFPRKPWSVCELVSPLKPFEAMALQKAVVVSSTRALLEIVEDGHNGLVFEKGNPGSLQAALEKLIANPTLMDQLGANARAWVERERSWDIAGRTCFETYKKVIK